MLVNDFRKLCGIEAYTPVDNVSELTARTNDEGFDTIFTGWLEVSRISRQGRAADLFSGRWRCRAQCQRQSDARDRPAKERGAKVFGIVGRDRLATPQKRATSSSSFRRSTPARVTPLSEGMQGIVWHCLVSHPELQVRKTKW